MFILENQLNFLVKILLTKKHTSYSPLCPSFCRSCFKGFRIYYCIVHFFYLLILLLINICFITYFVRLSIHNSYCYGCSYPCHIAWSPAFEKAAEFWIIWIISQCGRFYSMIIKLALFNYNFIYIYNLILYFLLKTWTLLQKQDVCFSFCT